MYLFLHSAVAAVLARRCRHPLTAFALGLLSHLALDAMPHGDESMGVWAAGDGHGGLTRLSTVIVADLFVVLTALLASSRFHFPSWPTLAAVLGACGPDLMEGFVRLTGVTGLEPLLFVHSSFHNVAGIIIPFWLGALTQVIAAAWLWWRMVRRT